MTMSVVHNFYQVTQNEGSLKSGHQVLQNSNSRHPESTSRMVDSVPRIQAPDLLQSTLSKTQTPDPQNTDPLKLRFPEAHIPEPGDCEVFSSPRTRSPKCSNPLLLTAPHHYPPRMLFEGFDSHARDPDPVHLC